MYKETQLGFQVSNIVLNIQLHLCTISVWVAIHSYYT